MADAVTELVHAALADVNELLDDDQRISTAPETALLGDSSKLDSLAWVNLVVAIEGRSEETYGRTVGLGDALASDDTRARLSTVGGLIEYVRQTLALADA